MRLAMPASLPESGLRPDPEGADPHASLEAALDRLATGPAAIVMASLGDLLLEPEPQNVPGTGSERPNWRRRYPWSLEELGRRAEIASVLERIDRLRHAEDDGSHPLMTPTTTDHELTADDLYLFDEGTHGRLAEKLGAHPARRRRRAASPSGRPTRSAVSVVGDFNGWDAGAAPARGRAGGSGIWDGVRRPASARRALQVPHRSRARRLRGRQGRPVRAAAERAARTPASVVWDLDLRLGRRRLDGVARGAQRARRADVDLRGAPGLVAPRPEDGHRSLTYRELAPTARRLRARRWASPTSSCCR